MGLFSRIVTYDRALRAGRTGAGGDAAVMAVVIEMAAAQWALDAGTAGPGCPYAFPPKEAWEAAQAQQFSAQYVADLLSRHGMDGVALLLGRQ